MQYKLFLSLRIISFCCISVEAFLTWESFEDFPKYHDQQSSIMFAIITLTLISHSEEVVGLELKTMDNRNCQLFFEKNRLIKFVYANGKKHCWSSNLIEIYLLQLSELKSDNWEKSCTWVSENHHLFNQWIFAAKTFKNRINSSQMNNCIDQSRKIKKISRREKSFTFKRELRVELDDELYSINNGESFNVIAIRRNQFE